MRDAAELHDELPDPTALTGNELQKSRRTRQRILEAARDILAEQGYKGLSTSAVAERAQLTRPAMLYHFGSRQELVTATIHHLARRRIEMYEEAVRGLDIEPGLHGRAIRAAMVDIAWDQLDAPEFLAFTELATAARTNPELAAVVKPAIAAFDKSRRRAAESVLPEGSYDLADFRMARDVVRFLTEGVKQQDSIFEQREERLAALRHFLKMLVSTQAGNDFLAAVAEDRSSEGMPPLSE